MKKITIDVMNQEIAKWLYDDSKIWWKEVGGKEIWEIFKKHDEGYTEFMADMYMCRFHEDNNYLMKILNKIMLKGYWYAVYPVKESKWIGRLPNKQLHTEISYYCAFSKDGMGRMGYGEKLNNQFYKKTPELAMQYSIYRLITKGLEY